MHSHMHRAKMAAERLAVDTVGVEGDLDARASLSCVNARMIGFAEACLLWCVD